MRPPRKPFVLVLIILILGCCLFTGCGNDAEPADDPPVSDTINDTNGTEDSDRSIPRTPESPDSEEPEPIDIEPIDITPISTTDKTETETDDSSATVNPTVNSNVNSTGDGSMVVNASLAKELLRETNTARESDTKDALVVDQVLEQAALAYAEAFLAGGKEFRATTDYLTLPSGESISTLLEQAGYTGPYGNFNYSIWRNDNSNSNEALTQLLDNVRDSNSYKTKAVEGDYSKIGIICATSAETDDPLAVIVIMYL